MLEKVIKRKFYLQQHLDAPLLYERESYLEKLSQRGLVRTSLLCYADYLLLIVNSFSLTDGSMTKVSLEEILEKSEQWAKLIKNHPMKRTECPSSKTKFFEIAINWLSEINRIDDRFSPENNIISAIFTRGHHKFRHLMAPMFNERINYLEYWKSRGAVPGTLRKIAQYQLHGIELMPGILEGVQFSETELQSAADEWCQMEVKSNHKLKGSERSRKSFITYVGGWLSFMGRLNKTHITFYCKDKVDSYLRWLTDDKGYSVTTGRGRFCQLKTFMSYLEAKELTLNSLSAVDLDAYIDYRSEVCGCNRKSISGEISVLRDFLRYAESQGWCITDLDKSLRAPRVYAREDIPSFIQWDEMQKVVSRSEAKENHASKRNHAIVMLLSVYGLRSSEVANLKLSDINWRKKEIYLRRAKLCKPQIMPLNEEVAQAVLDYILNSRNNEMGEENLFLGTRAPYKNITTSTVYQVATRALDGYGNHLKHRGPHSYRHTCATHLINTGHTMKEVADILGHQQLDTTQIYAKVDFVNLKKVSDMDWKGLL